jgi:hypothetical protein
LRLKIVLTRVEIPVRTSCPGSYQSTIGAGV